MMDGRIRCLGADVAGSNHHFTVVPNDGNTIYLHDSTQWVETALKEYLYIDALDCMIDGVEHQRVHDDLDYWIYAYLKSDGTLGVDLSREPTNHDMQTGFHHKFTDVTRRLIGGLHHMSAGVGLGLGAQNNNVGSYFNPLVINPAITITGGSADHTWTRVTTLQNRVTGWCWGDGREPLLMAMVCLTGSVAQVPVYAGISIDNGSPSRPACWIPERAGQVSTVTVFEPLNANSEGGHCFDLMLRSENPGVTAYINPQATMVCRYRG